MKKVLTQISFAFSAGAAGGLANAITVWLFGALGITAAAGVQIAPALTPPFLYQRIVWGGIWGMLLLIPLFIKRPALRVSALCIPPTLVQLFIVFPFMLHRGMMGLELGAATPIFVVLFNLVWAAKAWYWHRILRESA